MIKLDLSARPEAWHEVEIDIDGVSVPLRVRYWLLDKGEAARWTRQRLLLAQAIKTGQEETLFERLIQELSPEQISEIDALLRSRILDWDGLVDEQGVKIPVSPQTLDAILAQMRFWRPLFQGLIDASAGVAARKNALPGSTGGSTTSSHH